MPSIIRAHAEFGRLRYRGGPFAANFRLPDQAKLRWAPVGMAYRALDALAGSSKNTAGFRQFRTAVANSSVGRAFSSSDTFFPVSAAIITGVSGSNEYPDINKTADNLFRIIEDRKEDTLERGWLVEEYNRRYPKTAKLNEERCRDALELLRKRAQIIILADGTYVYFDQLKRINAVNVVLLDKEVTSLNDLIKVVFNESKKLGEILDLYLYDGENKELLRLTDHRPRPLFVSTYEEWHPIERGGIFDVLMHNHDFDHEELGRNMKAERDFVYFRNIQTQVTKYPNGPILQQHLDKYRNAFNNPKEVRFSCPQVRGERMLATKRYCWESDNSLYRQFYSPNSDRTTVDTAYTNLDQTIASKIGEILNRPENTGRTLRQVWEKEIEDGSMLGMPQAEKDEILIRKIPLPGEEGYDEWVDRNQMAMSKFYDKSTRIFAHICRLSRAYQLSVLEGIDCICNDVSNTGKTDLKVVDAGVGSAYFLEKLMQRMRELKLNINALAIDLSKIACAITKEVCKKFGRSVDVSKGNIAKITKFLEDVNPVKPGTKDLLLLNYVLQYVPIDEVLMEANKVLKNEGRILITNFKPKKSMRWNEFWTNVQASWNCGKEKKFGHGRLYEMLRYFLLFLKHPFGIVKFAMDIDRDIREGIIPENPDEKRLKGLLEKYGFEVLHLGDTHHHAAIRVYAKKVKDI